MTARHILVATLDCDAGPFHDPDCYTYKIECPGVTDDCRLWDDDCETCDGTTPPPGGLHHGVRHVRRDGRWSLPLEQCWWEHIDISGHLVEDLEFEGPGRYPVEPQGDGGFKIMEAG